MPPRKKTVLKYFTKSTETQLCHSFILVNLHPQTLQLYQERWSYTHKFLYILRNFSE